MKVKVQPAQATRVRAQSARRHRAGGGGEAPSHQRYYHYASPASTLGYRIVSEDPPHSTTGGVSHSDAHEGDYEGGGVYHEPQAEVSEAAAWPSTPGHVQGPHITVNDLVRWSTEPGDVMISNDRQQHYQYQQQHVVVEQPGDVSPGGTMFYEVQAGTNGAQQPQTHTQQQFQQQQEQPTSSPAKRKQRRNSKQRRRPQRRRSHNRSSGNTSRSQRKQTTRAADGVAHHVTRLAETLLTPFKSPTATVAAAAAPPQRGEVSFAETLASMKEAVGREAEALE